ncbi:MAG TPA: hypothetical protein EYG10_04070 [Gammaproteobacteria bacterium]|jgi:hypothetical protein|nr:hypothetical protein [Gammaproteobacteria bacterium]
MKLLEKFWNPVDSQRELLEENQMLRELITETLTEVESTQALVRDFIERLDSIFDSVEKISGGTE